MAPTREQLLRRRRRARAALGGKAVLSRDDLFERAAELAAELSVESELLDFLYDRSRFNSQSRAEWEAEVRSSMALERLMQYLGFTDSALAELVDEAALNQVVDKVRSTNGMLLLMFHGGFTTLRRKLYVTRVESQGLGVVLWKDGLRQDSGQALFSALRTIQAGKSVLLAPEGGEGRQRSTVTVFGQPSEAGAGAAFLASASRCETGWYNVLRRGDTFFPVIESGPRIEKGESADAFQQRLFQFYSERIEAQLTGDPQNILMRPKWVRRLIGPRQ